jgi:DAK2 domain fusion protein YloV
MVNNRINHDDIKKVLDIIIENFKLNEAKINNLNVFPVPDGDTGTNMLLTLKSIQQEVSNLENVSIKNISDKISYGALMGARGNSGVILSQILKGFFDIIMQKEDFGFNTLKFALKSSMELAYSSVQNPTEGTMLTTIKDIYKTVEEMNGRQVITEKLLGIIIDEAEKSVLRTTFLLPVLKQAGVVDAGAQGLLEILIGLQKAIKILAQNEGGPHEKISSSGSLNSQSAIGDEYSDDETLESSSLKKLDLISEIKNIYCTELLIKGDDIKIPRLREDIESLGDSALIVGNNRLVKIHVHTNYPQRVLHRALREGTLHEIQINNMVDQSKQAILIENVEEISVPVKNYGMIAIANGPGFEEIFKSIGIDYVVKGGQSMNPSTYDIVKAINKIESENIIILPNNKNIILTANQAKKIAKKNVSVIPTRSMPQGISAALSFNSDLDLDENVDNMNKAMDLIKTGEVTKAVRDANLYVGEIKKGAYIGLGDGKVMVIAESLNDAVIDLVRDLIKGGEEVITFYFGDGVTQENNKEIQSRILELYPGMEIEFHNGGQPFYPYIFAIE